MHARCTSLLLDDFQESLTRERKAHLGRQLGARPTVTEADATGMTDADVRASASMDGRLEAIQHIAKRLCNSISEETDRLGGLARVP